MFLVAAFCEAVRGLSEVGGCLAASRMPRGRAARKACEALGCRRGCPCRAEFAGFWPAQPLLSSHIRVVSSQLELEVAFGSRASSPWSDGAQAIPTRREGGWKGGSERAMERPFRRVAAGGPRPPGRLDASLSCSAPRYKRWSPATRSSDSDGPLTGPGPRPKQSQVGCVARWRHGKACVSGQPLLPGPMALSARRRPASMGGTNGARAHGVVSR